MARLVLVVDDDAALCEVMSEILAEEGYDVMVAGDGRRGLELARARLPDAALIDLRMPRMDGLALAEAVAGLAGQRRVALLFCSADADLRVLAEHLPGSRVLCKPFTVERLLGELRAALA